MNKKQLTTQQLASYIGCECMLDGSIRGVLKNIDAEKYPSVTLSGDTMHIRKLVAPSRIKLILNSISTISEEYLIKLFDKVFGRDDSVTNNIKMQLIAYWVDCDIEITNWKLCEDFWSVCDFTDSVKVIDELRKDGYDCDGLIEQGLAVDKTKI